jgi:hypothetical protein
MEDLMPTFHHLDFEFAIDDGWWRENGMTTFMPDSRAYRAGAPEPDKGLETLPIVIVPLNVIEPLRRQLSHGVFNDGVRPARERVREILIGFVDDDAVPPVEINRLPAGSPCMFKLSNGGHRFYCALAAGFSHIPAVEVPEIQPFEDV